MESRDVFLALAFVFFLGLVSAVSDLYFDIPFCLPLVFFAIVFLFGFVFLKLRSSNESEPVASYPPELTHQVQDSVSSFSQVGGFRIGRSYYLAANGTFPFAKLTVTRAELRLWTIFGTYEFEKSEVVSLKRVGRLLSSGLQIVHEKSFSKYVVFWTFNFKKLKARLEDMGYTVED